MCDSVARPNRLSSFFQPVCCALVAAVVGGMVCATIAHAQLLLGRGLFQHAKWSAQVALALAPDVGELHRLLGDIERELGNRDDARTHYRRYLELVPGRRRDQVRVEGILAELEG